MPKVVREYRDIAQLKHQLSKIRMSLEEAEASCEELLDLKTTWTNVRYVQNQFVERSVNFFKRTAEALGVEVMGNQTTEVEVSEEEKPTTIYPLSESRHHVISELKRIFENCPIYEVARVGIEEKLEVSGASIVFNLHTSLADLNVKGLQEIPEDHPVREFLVNGCSLTLKFEPPATTTVTPPPAVATASAKKRIQTFTRIGKLKEGLKRISNWPSGFRNDLKSHSSRFRVVPASEYKEARRRAEDAFRYYADHAKLRPEHFSSMTPSGELPILIEELPFLSQETIKACNEAGFYTIPDLVSFEGIDMSPRRLLKSIKRLGHHRLFELQCGLAELGIYRHDRDVMQLRRPTYSESLAVRDLDTSILHNLRFKWAWLWDQMVDQTRSIEDCILPKYKVHLERYDHDPEHWVISLPRVTPRFFESVFGKFGKSGTEVEALDTFQRKSWDQLYETMIRMFDHEETNEDLEEGLTLRQNRLMAIIESYAAFKAVYGQDENGFSWYDHKFGHMPWIVRSDPEKDFRPNDEHEPHTDYSSNFIVDSTDFDIAKELRGVRGVPLSAYGKIGNREHPVWWKTDQH